MPDASGEFVGDDVRQDIADDYARLNHDMELEVCVRERRGESVCERERERARGSEGARERVCVGRGARQRLEAMYG